MRQRDWAVGAILLLMLIGALVNGLLDPKQRNAPRAPVAFEHALTHHAGAR